MTDVIVAPLFTQPPYNITSTHKIGLGHKTVADLTAKELQTYVFPWYESVRRAKANAVLLYDVLPDGFTLPGVCMVQGSPRPDLPVCHRRWFAVKAWLDETPSVRRLVFTDVNDVAWTADVFAWWNALRLPYQLLFMEERGLLRDCDWLREPQSLPPPVEWQRAFAKDGPFAERLVPTAGVWGGYRGVVEDFLSRFMNELLRFPDDTKMDMSAFVYTVFRWYSRQTCGLMKTAHGAMGVTRYDVVSPFIHDRQLAETLLKEAGNAA